MADDHIDTTRKDSPGDGDGLNARVADENTNLDMEACLAAMRGEKVPWALGRPLTQMCLIRGMRYHSGFAGEVRSATPAFSRAWNARCIMSNDIPDIASPEHIPYCIWHPDVASESTYRRLVQRYPDMRYQVARACAVAGYVDLYRELDVLPEVHVAEEARDNDNLAIFQDIMAAPVRYAVMDDYHRTVNLDNPRAGAFLNGDTAVRSALDRKRKIEMPTVSTLAKELGIYDDDDNDDSDEEYYSPLIFNHRFKVGYFNITEDGNVDTYDGFPSDTAPHLPPKPDLISPLLYSPLPPNLPPGNKDILILMAAYNGNIDRYSRLRRPLHIPHQISCLMRGIYHNPLFAKWWADRIATADAESDTTATSRLLDDMPDRYMLDICKAITARFIMSGDLSRVVSPSAPPPDEMPYIIWYPVVPTLQTMSELARRRPDMTPQIARACIVGGYATLFEQLDPEPDRGLLAEADGAHDPCFGQFLGEKMERTGVVVDSMQFYGESWKLLPYREIESAVTRAEAEDVCSVVDERLVTSSWLAPWIYEGYSVDVGRVELSVCARDG